MMIHHDDAFCQHFFLKFIYSFWHLLLHAVQPPNRIVILFTLTQSTGCFHSISRAMDTVNSLARPTVLADSSRRVDGLALDALAYVDSEVRPLRCMHQLAAAISFLPSGLFLGVDFSGC